MSRQFDEAYYDLPFDFEDMDYYVYNDIEYKRMEEFPDYYVSSDGRIISTKKRKMKEMQTWPNQYGHLYTRLVGKNHKRSVSVHREVAKAFLYKPEGCDVVRHLDDDPTYNCVDNLRWGTQADNMRDCIEHERNYTRPVYCIEDGTVYSSCADLAREKKVSRASVTRNCQDGKPIKGKHYNYLDERGKNNE